MSKTKTKTKTKNQLMPAWLDHLKTVTNNNGLASVFMDYKSAAFSLKVSDGSRRDLSACVSQMSKPNPVVRKFWEGVSSIPGVKVTGPRANCHYGQATSTTTTSTIELVTYVHNNMSPCKRARDKGIVSAFMGYLGDKPITTPINSWRPTNNDQHTRSMQEAVKCMMFLAKIRRRKEGGAASGSESAISEPAMKQSL